MYMIEGFMDRLSCVYTGMGVMVVGILVGVAPYFSPPIRCWCPAQFTDSHVNYVETVSSVQPIIIGIINCVNYYKSAFAIYII